MTRQQMLVNTRTSKHVCWTQRRLLICAVQVVTSVNGPNRENSMFLPGHKCPDTLTATSNMTEAVTSNELVLMVVPTPYLAATVKQIAALLQPNQIFVSCTKVRAMKCDAWDTQHLIVLGLELNCYWLVSCC